MKLPVFSKDRSKEAQLEAQEKLERALAESFRALGSLFQRAAELLEAQRLQRNGYEKQGRFLERLDKPDPDKK